MDANQYMNETLDALRRIAYSNEQILKLMTGGQVVGTVETTVEKVQVGDKSKTTTTTKVTPKDTPLEKANEIARESAAAATSPNGSGQTGETGSTGASATAGEKPKKVSVDDVRAALKAYAAKEGNPAAMALLGEFGAKSVSELASGDEAEAQKKMAEFVKKCGS
jgi:hypothetical protein